MRITTVLIIALLATSLLVCAHQLRSPKASKSKQDPLASLTNGTFNWDEPSSLNLTTSDLSNVTLDLSGSTLDLPIPDDLGLTIPENMTDGYIRNYGLPTPVYTPTPTTDDWGQSALDFLNANAPTLN